jgi:hypothetical protein
MGPAAPVSRGRQTTRRRRRLIGDIAARDSNCLGTPSSGSVRLASQQGPRKITPVAASAGKNLNACSLQGGAPGLRTWSIGGVSAACLAAKGRTRTPDGPRSEELPLAA